eukprot:1149005-Pelagomonas_calceolata.AAC.2
MSVAIWCRSIKHLVPVIPPMALFLANEQYQYEVYKGHEGGWPIARDSGWSAAGETLSSSIKN